MFRGGAGARLLRRAADGLAPGAAAALPRRQVPKMGENEKGAGRVPG